MLFSYRYLKNKNTMTEIAQPDRAYQSFLSLAFVCLFVVGALLRVVNIWQPIDQPSWREADVAGIARNFDREEMNLFYPRIDWRGDGPGYAEMELPLYPWTIAVLYKVFGNHEVIGRVVSYVLSLLTLGVFFRFAVYLLPPVGAIAASTFFVFNPLVINISTSLQPDGLMFLCYILAPFAFVRWLQHGSQKDYCIAMISTAVAILAKATAALLGVAFLLLLLSEKGPKALLQARMWFFGVVALMPALLWHVHARNLWLTYGNSLGVSNRSHGAGWALFTDPSFVEGILRAEVFYVATPMGLVLMGLGIFLRRAKVGVRFSLYWLVALWIYYLVAARTTGDEWAIYYHLVSVPPIAFLFGKGVEALRGLTSRPSITAILLSLPLLLVELVVPGSLKFHVLSIGCWLAIVGITMMREGFWRRWQAGLNGGPLFGSATPLLSTVVCYAGVFFVCSTLVHEVEATYQNQTADRHIKLYQSAQAFKSSAVEPGLIGASGGPCRDRLGSPQAHNASYMFYWMDRKGFNVCLEEQSASSLAELSRRGARYYIFEKPYVLQPKAGLETELRNAFPVIQETDVAILFDLSSASTASYALSSGPVVSAQSVSSPLK